MPSVRSAVVPKGLEGPLDRAVRSLFPADGPPAPPADGPPPQREATARPTSWGTARAWIAQGKIRVGGQLVTEATARVRVGMEVSLDERARRPRGAELSDDDVVHVDPHVIVVAKPPGISTIPYDDTETDPTLDALVRDWVGRRSRGSKGSRPSLGIVHRLDKDTSGLLVFARSWLAKQSLASQFRKHTVHRRYLAIAHGRVTAATIRSFLVENRGDGLRGSARTRSRGRPGGDGDAARAPPGTREAVTHVEPLESLDAATLVACTLETGRTHQIRIHLSESGHPVVGERVYVRRFAGPTLDAPRLMLHAAELGFVHPATEREMRWELPLPRDMESVLERLRRK